MFVGVLSDVNMTSACVVLFRRYLPREVDPLVYNMSHEDPGSVSYSEIGGLSEQIRELREVRHICSCCHQTFLRTLRYTKDETFETFVQV